VPFHTITWPAQLIGSDLNWNLPYYIASNEWLNWAGGRKFSKTNNVGIFADELTKTGIHPDVWRFYLTFVYPSGKDVVFSWDDLQSIVNSELVDNFGNFYYRTLHFISKNFNGKIPTATLNKDDLAFLKDFHAILRNAKREFEVTREKEALKEILRASSLANSYFQNNAPWRQVKEDRARAGTVLNVCAGVVDLLLICLYPVIPVLAQELWVGLGNSKNVVADQKWKDWIWNLKGQKLSEDLCGQKLGDFKIPFEKIDDKKINELKKRFGGASVAVEGKGKGSVKPLVKYDDFAKLDLRVGSIVSAERLPKQDRLLELKVDVGEESPRTLVAGIGKGYKPDDLKGKQIVVIVNLEPRKIAGVESNGMLLAVGDKKNMALLTTDN
ncbi:MAG: class I tRNA ligase family protein, partial [Candidatus Diapherotrites archaeon]|nr:class I tRNA ligase family protein [Candidatus Diapherotrites archaeon]